MSLQSELEAERVPRSEEVAARVAKRIFGAWKLWLMGLVWLVTVADIAGVVFILGAVALMRLIGTHKGEMIEQVMGLVALGVSQILAWSWFALRVRKMRASAASVGREGRFVTTRLYREYWSHRRTRFLWRWHFELDGKAYADWAGYVGLLADAPDSQTVSVLALPDARYGLLFSTPDGHVTRIRPDTAGQRTLDSAAEGNA